MGFRPTAVCCLFPEVLAQRGYRLLHKEQISSAQRISSSPQGLDIVYQWRRVKIFPMDGKQRAELSKKTKSRALPGTISTPAVWTISAAGRQTKSGRCPDMVRSSRSEDIVCSARSRYRPRSGYRPARKGWISFTNRAGIRFSQWMGNKRPNLLGKRNPGLMPGTISTPAVWTISAAGRQTKSGRCPDMVRSSRRGYRPARKGWISFTNSVGIRFSQWMGGDFVRMHHWERYPALPDDILA